MGLGLGLRLKLGVQEEQPLQGSKSTSVFFADAREVFVQFGGRVLVMVMVVVMLVVMMMASRAQLKLILGRAEIGDDALQLVQERVEGGACGGGGGSGGRKRHDAAMRARRRLSQRLATRDSPTRDSATDPRRLTTDD